MYLSTWTISAMVATVLSLPIPILSPDVTTGTISHDVVNPALFSLSQAKHVTRADAILIKPNGEDATMIAAIGARSTTSDDDDDDPDNIKDLPTDTQAEILEAEKEEDTASAQVEASEVQEEAAVYYAEHPNGKREDGFVAYQSTGDPEVEAELLGAEQELSAAQAEEAAALGHPQTKRAIITNASRKNGLGGKAVA